MTEFADWQAVYDLSLRYAEGIDRRDWELFASCFAPQVRIDFSSFSHRPAPAEPLTVQQWVAAVRSTIDGFPSTQHLIGNHRITLAAAAGGAAAPSQGRYTAYIQAQHWVDTQRWYLIGGYYDNEVVRLDGDWKLSAVTLNQTWDAGDRSLLREVNRR